MVTLMAAAEWARERASEVVILMGTTVACSGTHYDIGKIVGGFGLADL